MGTFVAVTALFCTGATFISTPYFSALTDRHSRKLILVLVQAAQSVSALLTAILYWFDFGSHWLLAGAQLIFWVSSNLAWQVNKAFTQENYVKAEYAKISGYQEVVMQGTTLGAGALGVVLLEIWGIAEFSLFAASASALAVCCYLLTPYNRQLRTSAKAPLLSQIKELKSIYCETPAFYAFLLISCLSYPVLTFLGKLVPIWFSEQNISGNWFALFSVALGLGSLITGLLISRLLNLFSHQRIMQCSIMLLALILLLMSGVTQPLTIIVLMIFFGFFNALNRIARTNWMHHTTSIAQRGRIDGGLAMFTTAVQSLSYVLIVFLAHFDAIDNGFFIVGLVLFCCRTGC
ncbi:MAG: hypothetical protein OFPI_05610 [Osedax symbiont Rs2]|nr:MAG: hypothetical protein OFPI_05610 [Osedax symbiont Rs2]